MNENVVEDGPQTESKPLGEPDTDTTPEKLPQEHIEVDKSAAPARDSKPKKRGNNWDDVSRRAWQESKKLKTSNDGSDLEPKEDRKPKRKVACLIGYCGTGYHGMQLNPPNETIEGALFDAFVKAGAVSRDNADDPKKVSLNCSSRAYIDPVRYLSQERHGQTKAFTQL